VKPTWTSDCGTVQLYLGDCLEVLPTLGQVDAVVTDPPYGTTACDWDTVVPFAPMWCGIRHAAKKSAAIVVTASQPFTTSLINSNRNHFRYCWVWDKEIPAGFNYARFQPMRQHEDVVVFYDSSPFYNSEGEKYTTPIRYKPAASPSDSSRMSHTMNKDDMITATHKRRRSIIRFRKVRAGVHPTQKPTELMEYFANTYTVKGETILDPFMGSGTTGVACVNLNRKFIGIEIDPGYFEIAKKRIVAALNSKAELLIA